MHPVPYPAGYVKDMKGMALKIMKKKIFSFTAALALACSLFVCASAADETKVYVTISDGSGSLVMKADSVTVSDADGDGSLTVNDALYCAHEQYFNGGAVSGYASESTQYGLSLTKLWGVSNGGSYGYYVNNTMAMSLSDTVSNGDYVNAYIYTDTVGYSDTYCYFDLHNYTTEENGSVTLTLMSIGFDDQYNPVSYPVSGASVVIDGAKTNYVTDDDGSVSIICDKAGSFVISAVSDGQTLVPPVSILTVNAVTTSVSSDTADGDVQADAQTEAQTEAQASVTDDSVTNAPETVKTENSPATGDSGIIVSALALSAAACVVSVSAAVGKKKK